MELAVVKHSGYIVSIYNQILSAIIFFCFIIHKILSFVGEMAAETVVICLPVCVWQERGKLREIMHTAGGQIKQFMLD